MLERIFNVFLLFDQDVCSEVSYCIYNHDGTDEAAFANLTDAVNLDFSRAKKFKLTTSFTRQQYNARSRLGDAHFLIDELFEILDAGPTPIFCITPVRDGEIFFNYSYGIEKLDVNDVAKTLGERGYMVDWLEKYTTDAGIDLSQLIHDDYFLAIKLTFNARLYVSAMKLLVSCIDSVAYIEYGDIKGKQPFILWLESYADLAPLSITAEELWELRNGILHMTSLNSKKVLKNKVRRISFRVSALQQPAQQESGEVFYFDFYPLIQTFGAAQEKWISTYNVIPDKFLQFIERYDQTISDSRVAVPKQ